MQDEQVFLKKYVRDNDPQAFEELARRYSGFVYGVCLRVTGNEHDAEDATQECFLELAKKPESVTGSFVGWLHLRALSRARDVVKRRGRRQRREQSAASHEMVDAEPSWDEIAPALDAAVAELPDELRMPLVLHYFHGRKQREVATELGLDHSTISRRLSKGVERLRIRLRHAGVAVSVAALATLLTNHAASAAVPAALAASLGKMAVAGVGSASAGVTASATATAGAAGGTVTGGLGMMKLAFVGLTTAAVVTAGVVGFQSETQQTIELAVAPPPVVSEPPAPSPNESNTIFDEIHSNAIPIRPRPQVDVEARIIIMKKTAAEELGVSDLTDIEILNAEKGRELIRNVKDGTGATTITSPHVLTLCGQERNLRLARTGSYISGYEKTEARPEENSEYDYYWVPVLSSYELAHTSLTVKTEVDKNRVAFLQLVVQCDESTLVQCEGEIPIPEENTGILVNIDEVVKDTLLAELDEKALAAVRLKHGETLVIPAEFSRTKSTDIPKPFSPDDYKRGEAPPPMLGDDETAFVLVTPTLLLQEEVDQGDEPNMNGADATNALKQDRGPGSDQRVFHQYDVTDLLIQGRTRETQAFEEVFLPMLAQLTGPENWSSVVTHAPEMIGNISAPDRGLQEGLLLCRQGYLMVYHTPQIQDAVAKILKELRTTVVEPFQRPSNSCAIVGQVMSAETGLPVGQATVFVFYPKTYEGFFLETNEEGRFNFNRIPSGEYLLMAVAEGYGAFPTYHGAADGDALIPIEITEDAPRKEMLFKLPLPDDAANNE